MKLSFPTSATITRPRWLVDGRSGWGNATFPIRYGLLRRRDSIALIDTGFSEALFSTPGRALSLYRRILAPKLTLNGDALAEVERLGARADDVTDIVVTHLHADHICGLDRFPKARLHISEASIKLWRDQQSVTADLHVGFFRALMPRFDLQRVRLLEVARPFDLPWGGKGRDLFGDGSVVAVDLPGHMPGHFGVFFPYESPSLLYAVDADWTLPPLMAGRSPNWPVHMIVADKAAARRSAAIVRAAAAAGVCVRLCHDPEPWP